MARQLQMAFDASNWFGCAGRDLRYLPCSSSDAMMSASALLFGKWFPSVVITVFALIGVLLTWIWRRGGDTSRRRFTLIFGLWLVVPTAYCLFQSLALLPVMGKAPALVSYGGSAVAMAWFGVGVLAAMASGGLSEHGSDIRMGRIAGCGRQGRYRLSYGRPQRQIHPPVCRHRHRLPPHADRCAGDAV